jgi:hypothetical protein
LKPINDAKFKATGPQKKVLRFQWDVGFIPLVNVQKTVENHHVQWVNPLFLWSFSIAMQQIAEGNGFYLPQSGLIK